MTLTVFMKKYGKYLIMALVVLIIILLLIFPPFGKLECKIKSAPSDLSANFKYTANFSFWMVNDLTVEEVVSSKDKDLLENYKNEMEEQYRIYDDFNSISNDIVLNNDSLISVFHIDYDKLNSSESKKINKNNNLNKRISVNRLKKMYKKNGASCHYK